MRRIGLVAALVITVVGCNHSYWSVVPTTMPDGGHGVVVSCVYMKDCLILAGSSCPNGWHTIGDTSPVQIGAVQVSGIQVNNIASQSSNVVKVKGPTTMMVECTRPPTSTVVDRPPLTEN
jgi:hypothetical protein